MTPEQKAQRLERELAQIRAAGAAVVADWPPLTDYEIEQLAFILAPHVTAPRRHPTAALPQAA